ncbi:cytochrome p450 71a8 [Phtheirospermum japonicum]|uniref:Cytochrome p450 71a8 n=1 Tax=Phtheirospermum japonicum TaxID=374723 RepID=A0A830BLP1_9LAMI|nr:cytochrome p450 71a8 [Phtheirospermum japonicum]
MEQFQLYAVLFTLSVVLYAWLFTKSLARKKHLPPSPPTLPVIGNLHQLGHLAHRSLRDLSMKYGPAMLLKFGSRPVLVVSSAEVAKEIMKTHDLAFAGKPVLSAPKKIFYDLNDPVNLPYGDKWRKLRSIFMHELLGTSRVKSANSIREEEVALLVKKIKMSSAPVNLTHMFMTLANDFICRASFGRKHSEMQYGARILELIDRAVGLLFNFTLGEFVPWLSWMNWLNRFNAELDACAREIDQVMDEVLADHLENISSGDKENFVDILLDIYKGNVSGVSIDLISVKAVILDVLGAGTETSARTLVWIMTELIRHPQAMKKLQDEVRETTKGKDRITDDDLRQMHYLKAVIKETFRMHPPIAIYFRAAREHVNLMGYNIEPEMMVLINAWAIGRDPTSWEVPEKFMPERFLNSSVDFRGFNFELLPFGAGRRICPGLGFAVPSIEHTVANLIKNFDFALPGGARGEDLDATEKPGFTVGKKEPLIVVPSCFSP